MSYILRGAAHRGLTCISRWVASPEVERRTGWALSPQVRPHAALHGGRIRLLLVPVIVNIVLYHVFLDPQGLPMGIIISLLALFLLWIYRFKFPAIFQP